MLQSQCSINRPQYDQPGSDKKKRSSCIDFPIPVILRCYNKLEFSSIMCTQGVYTERQPEFSRQTNGMKKRLMPNYSCHGTYLGT